MKHTEAFYNEAFDSEANVVYKLLYLSGLSVKANGGANLTLTIVIKKKDLFFLHILRRR